MAVCFIFIDKLDETENNSLLLDDLGDVQAPFMRRSWEDLTALQSNAKTVVVLPTDWCSLHELGLALLSERKARAAIPFALEEHLSDKVSDLFFAFDKAHYRDGHYLVAVIARTLMQRVLSLFQTHAIHVDALTVDWFALNPEERLMTDRNLLVNEVSFKGAVPLLLMDSFLASHPLAGTLIQEPPSEPWLARRLLAADYINFCQGDYLQEQRGKGVASWYYASAVLLGALFLSSVFMNGFQSIRLSQQIGKTDEAIAQVYRSFFPEATHVISPKFRITQLLKGQSATQGGDFKQLIQKASLALSADSEVMPTQLRYQNQIMTLILSAPDFGSLERLGMRLKMAGIKVNQTQAASEGGKVIATLELTL